MCPEVASRQLEISPSTRMSVKFRASRSRIRTVSSVTDHTRRSGIKLNCSCVVIRHLNPLPEKFSIFRGCNKKMPKTYPQSDHQSLDAQKASVPPCPRDRPGRFLLELESPAHTAPYYLFHVSRKAHPQPSPAKQDTP